MLFQQIWQKIEIYTSKCCYLSAIFLCLWVLKSIILGKSFFVDVKSAKIYYFANENVHG